MVELKRCFWASQVCELYQDYHDQEWGVPVYDDEMLYEMFLLESFQAGLSWLCILKKRENFRKAFDGFDLNKIAAYDQIKKDELLSDTGIIRNRLKIEAAIINAQAILKIKEEYGSFSEYLWSFTNHQVIKNMTDELPTKTELSDRMAKDMKKRGMKFMGSVTLYSFLQAVGIVNDHTTTCFKHQQV